MSSIFYALGIPSNSFVHLKDLRFDVEVTLLNWQCFHVSYGSWWFYGATKTSLFRSLWGFHPMLGPTYWSTTPSSPKEVHQAECHASPWHSFKPLQLSGNLSPLDDRGARGVRTVLGPKWRFIWFSWYWWCSSLVGISFIYSWKLFGAGPLAVFGSLPSTLISSVVEQRAKHFPPFSTTCWFWVGVWVNHQYRQENYQWP